MSTATDNSTLADYFETFQRRRKLFFTIFGSVVAVAVFVAIVLPSVYMASAHMQVDLEGSSADLLEPLALTTYADQYVDSLRQRALTTPTIKGWIEQSEVYADERDEYSEDELASRIRENISIEMLTTAVTDPRSGRPLNLITGFIAAFYAYKPEDAQIIAQKLAWAFRTADQKIRSERAAAASAFLGTEIGQKRKRINELEAKIAEFKEANAGSLPQLMGLNMSVLERTERDIQDVEMDIGSREQDKLFRESQLQEILQSSRTPDRLRQLQGEYIRAISVYGPDHPDVVRIKRQVAALTDGTVDTGESEQIQLLELELAEAQQRYSDVHPDVLSLQRKLAALRSKGSAAASDSNINPRYLQLYAQVNAIELQLAGLRDRLRTLKIKYDEIQDRIARMPQVERDYLTLTRDLEAEETAYNDLGARLANAQQTESFETGKTGARLTMLRGPSLPESPVKPPRLAIVILGTILAAGLALGITSATEAMDPTVRSNRDVEKLVNAPPIAEIPLIHSSSSAVHMRHPLAIIGTAVLVIGAAILIIWSRM